MRFFISERDAEEIRLNTRFRKRGPVKPQQRRRSVPFQSSQGLILFGKTNQAWQTDGTVSVNPIKPDGTEDTDNPVSVFILLDKSATDVTSGYWPVITDDMDIAFAKDKEGDYKLVRPDVNNMPVVTDLRYSSGDDEIQVEYRDEGTWTDKIDTTECP